MSIGKLLEVLSQQVLAGIILVGRLGVRESAVLFAAIFRGRSILKKPAAHIGGTQVGA